VGTWAAVQLPRTRSKPEQGGDGGARAADAAPVDGDSHFAGNLRSISLKFVETESSGEWSVVGESNGEWYVGEWYIG
jgi:hypothetical protein